jgi:hypothetical protein
MNAITICLGRRDAPAQNMPRFAQYLVRPANLLRFALQHLHPVTVIRETGSASPLKAGSKQIRMHKNYFSVASRRKSHTLEK